jgi:hypothetical protein
VALQTTTCSDQACLLKGVHKNNHVKPCQNLPFHPHQSSVALVAVQKLKPLDSSSSVLDIVTKQSCIFKPDSVLLSRGGFHRYCIKWLRLQNARPLFHVRKTSPMRAHKSGILGNQDHEHGFRVLGRTIKSVHSNLLGDDGILGIIGLWR